MKEYRLLSWPDLPAEFSRTGHRRALSELSQRHVSIAQLVEASGLRKGELRTLVDMLDRRGVLEERDGSGPDSFLDSIGRLGWFRRGARPVVAEAAQTTR